MKKLLSLVIVLTLLLTMGIGVFAIEYKDDSQVRIDKNITAQGMNPEETFNFTVGAGNYIGPIANVEAPVIDGFSIPVGQDEASNFTDINLPEFTAIGVYTYVISETSGNTAGMKYLGGPNTLKITVINDGQGKFKRVLTMTSVEDGENIKVDAFENEFYSGNLVINKEITGNNAVFTDKFDVTVTLTPEEGKNIKEGPIAVSDAVDGEYNVVKDSETGIVTITFTVTNGSEVSINNIPYDVSYVVTEDSTAVGTDRDYTATITNAEGDINAASQTVNIENKLDTTIETGVNLDNLPYILILGAVTIGLFGFTMKRRFNK